MRRTPFSSSFPAFLGIAASFLLGTASLFAQEVAQTQPEAETDYQAIIKNLAQDHNTAKARAALLLLLKSNPDYAKPRYNLALIAASDHHWSLALQWMGQYRDMVDPTRRTKEDKIIAKFRLTQAAEFRAAVTSTLALSNAGNTEEAATSADKLRDIDDSQVVAYLFSGILEGNLHHYNDSEKLLREALKLAPDANKDKVADALTSVLTTHAKSAGASGKYFTAGSLYEEAWHYEPQHPEIGLAAASSYALSGHYNEGAKIAQDLAQNSNPDIQTQAATLLQNMGKTIDR